MPQGNNKAMTNILVREAALFDASDISSIATEVQGMHTGIRPDIFKPPSIDLFPIELITAQIADSDWKILRCD
jgi:hypothetical protein